MVEHPMKRRRTHDCVEGALKRKVEEITSHQTCARPKLRPQMLTR